MAIQSKGRGKSGGARVITYLDIKIVENAQDIGVNILTIYDKSKPQSVSTEFVRNMVRDLKEEE